MRRFAVVVGLLTLTLAHIQTVAQEATPTPPALPEATAPFGLGTVTLPGDETTILALFAAMPAEVAGEERTGEPFVATGRIRLPYGDAQTALEPTFLQAVDFSRSDFFPADFTVEMFVTSSASTADYGAVGYGRDGEIVWIQAESTVGVTGAGEGTPEIALPIYTIAWGAAGSSWLFSATSFTQTGLNALVTAFVQTAGGIPATPVATPASG
jgi:hypothetical protein